MRFYFPDSQDQIDPVFDFNREATTNLLRVRQRDERYAHEVLSPPPYGGILISMAAVDGVDGRSGRYTAAQRRRLLREGARDFFRLPDDMMSMGDCGSFSWASKPAPRVSVEDVVDFYERSQVDAGLALDHIIFDYQPHRSPHDEWVRRWRLTLELALEFKLESDRRRSSYEPVGVAQGWSPKSYADAVWWLQRFGYRRIAIGGMATSKSTAILDVLHAIAEVRKPKTELHLLGAGRVDHMEAFARYGVTSFDTTSPFRRAFTDAKHNYHLGGSSWVALRVPTCDTAKLSFAVTSSKVGYARALATERATMTALRRFNSGEIDVEQALEPLCEYQRMHSPTGDYEHAYRAALQDRPWTRCRCQLCRTCGIEIMLFRGIQRNKRRGFHNLANFAAMMANGSPP